MREIVIDCSTVQSIDEFWQRYVDAAAPEGASMFGRNLDAFWDAIEGGGPGWPGEVTLILEHSANLSALQTRGGEGSFLVKLKDIADRARFVRIELK
jgi:ribonuclease inhibitor